MSTASGGSHAYDATVKVGPPADKKYLSERREERILEVQTRIQKLEQMLIAVEKGLKQAISEMTALTQEGDD